MALSLNWTNPQTNQLCTYHRPVYYEVSVDTVTQPLDPNAKLGDKPLPAIKGSVNVKLASYDSAAFRQSNPNGYTARNMTLTGLPVGEPVAWIYTQLKAMDSFKGSTDI